MFRMFWLSLALLLCAGCEKSRPETTPALVDAPAATTDALLDDMSGVWRGMEQGALLYLLHEQGKVGMFIGDDEVPVRLGSIDLDQSTVNFTLTSNGDDVVWTVRRLFDKERNGFYLMLTLNDGQQETLGFVRKISDEDRHHLASAEPTSLDAGVLGSLLASGEAWQDMDSEGDDEADESNEGDAALTEATDGADEMANDAATAADAEPTAAGPSFDCSKPLNTAEKLVCDDPELAELDRKLSQAFRTLVGRSKQPEAEHAIHMRWLAETRNRCVKTRCLRKAYESRLEVFKGAYAYSEHAE